MAKNPKSDIDAKNAFAQELLERGFDSAQVTGSPADITAQKDGDIYYYEIKFTRQKNKYFGAATLTEWEAALQNDDRYVFVIAFKRNDKWQFHEYTPEEFMQFSYIPPFKIFFNVSVANKKDSNSRNGNKAVKLTRNRVELMTETYLKLRDTK